MSKIENRIRQQISKAHSKVIKRLKDIIKNGNVAVISNSVWNKPSDLIFKNFGNDANAWLKHCGVGEKLDNYDLIDILCGPESYDFVTKSELMKFKRDIWPRLYAEWEESEKKRKGKIIPVCNVADFLNSCPVLSFISSDFYSILHTASISQCTFDHHDMALSKAPPGPYLQLFRQEGFRCASPLLPSYQ